MELIPMDDLVDRGVYAIRSRNLSTGVWDAERKGFIGIREKFGSHYLFMEYHYDYDPHIGTVSQMEFLDSVVPEEIRLIEGWGICEECQAPTEWIPNAKPMRPLGRQAHVDGSPPHSGKNEIRAVYAMNQELFDLLESIKR